MASFLVYVNGKPILKGLRSLDEAKEFAAEHTSLDESVRIENFVSPAQSNYWRFDKADNVWVCGKAP